MVWLSVEYILLYNSFGTTLLLIKSHSTCFVVRHMSDPCMYKIAGLCFTLKMNKYEDEGKRNDCLQLVMGTSNELELVSLLIKSLINRLLCSSRISVVVYELGFEETLLVLCIALQSSEKGNSEVP
jgi:hypothetical protein